MSRIFQKLNLKTQHEILVLNAPSSFEPELASLAGVTIYRDLTQVKSLGFALVFANTQADVDSWAKALASHTEGDVLLWFAYPKASSKKYRCEFNRDTGWGVLSALGFESVRQVAIDEDWSALRFRRVPYVKVPKTSTQ